MYLRRGILTVGIALLLASGPGFAETLHADATSCSQIEQAIRGGSDFSTWAKDPTRAELLRAEYSELEFYAGLVSVPLSRGASIEDTAAVHRDFVAAGDRFVKRAHELGVTFPPEATRQANEFARRCKEPYQR